MSALPQGWRKAGPTTFKFQSQLLTMEVDTRRGLVSATGWERVADSGGELSWDTRPLEGTDFITIGSELKALGLAMNSIVCAAMGVS